MRDTCPNPTGYKARSKRTLTNASRRVLRQHLADDRQHRLAFGERHRLANRFAAPDRIHYRDRLKLQATPGKWKMLCLATGKRQAVEEFRSQSADLSLRREIAGER